MNKVGDPAQLQSVVGIEIDAFNRLWILDQGRVGNNVAVNGSMKLIIWDVRENHEVMRHVFPHHVAHPHGSFLNDLVLDQPRGFAYISDSGVPVNGDENNIHGQNRRRSAYQPVACSALWGHLH
jgi:hypothetical protein